jgi:hypothetical protein
MRHVHCVSRGRQEAFVVPQVRSRRPWLGADLGGALRPSVQLGVPESAVAAMAHTTTGAKEIKGGGKLTYEMPMMNVSTTDP